MQLLSHNNNHAFNDIQQTICNGWWTNWNLMFILFFSSDWIKKSKKPADFAYFTQWPNFEAASSQTSQLPQFFHPVPQWGKSVQWHRGEMNQTVQEIQHPWTSLVASILSHTVSVHYYNHYLYRYCHRQLVLVTFSQFHQPTCCFIYKWYHFQVRPWNLSRLPYAHCAACTAQLMLQNLAFALVLKTLLMPNVRFNTTICISYIGIWNILWK